MREDLALQGINIHLDLNLYALEEIDTHVISAQSRFLAGYGYDVLMLTNAHPVRAFINHGFLADINELIENYGDRTDYFYNVIEAMETESNLHVFPLDFAIRYVGINSALPQSYIDRFAEYNAISSYQLAKFYSELRDSYPEYAYWAIGSGFPFQEGITDWLNTGVDWETRKFSLGAADFRVFLDHLQIAAAHYHEDNYVFSFSHSNAGGSNFVNYIPIASADGRVAAWDAHTRVFGVNAETDGALAFAFLQHAADAWANSAMVGTRTLVTPITVVESSDYINMPVSVASTLLMIPKGLHDEIISSFIAGELDSRDATVEILDILTYWITHEEALEINMDVLEWVALKAERAALPVRTISIFAFADYYMVLRQAEESLNRKWASEGREYNFRLEISTYHYGERNFLLPIRTRLQASLMAGQGYDIFIQDRHPLWGWASSGLLTDIWDLIDACPYTAREDFYLNVLEAYELNGGLWAFPLSFGFEYIGISSSLPQSITDRFAQHTTITQKEVLEIYIDLMTTYGDEFRHMSIGFAENSPGSILMRALTGFIDLETRTSSLNSNEFVQLLDIFHQVYTGSVHVYDNHFVIGYALSGGGLRGWVDIIRENADINAFRIISGGQAPVFAFINETDPGYVHFMPLTDEQGRLFAPSSQADGTTGTWAAMVFPAAGDGELAWEFTRHLMVAMVDPVPAAQRPPTFGWYNWGRYSLATPICRDLYESHISNVMDDVWIHLDFLDVNFWDSGWVARNFDGINTAQERAEATEHVIMSIANLNEKPVVLPPMFPDGLRDGLLDTLEQFLHGLISSEAAAQQMHNRVSLWLIE
ncbi:MAG: hypothetical protein FWC89_03745 [Defluviitaleaceae bacterium]|nr:hypothetical protein [Defluviitaleaceae bacterium]